MKRTLENPNSLFSIRSKSTGPRERRILHCVGNAGLLVKKGFYHLLLTFVLLIGTYSVGAIDYYVSNSGSDSNSGLSDAQAKATIDGINGLELKSGDRVFFKRGDTFSGTLTFNGADTGNTYFGAYGTGENPIISGFTEVSGWTNTGGNIWESTSAVSTLSTCNMVTIGGEIAPLGRYPNLNNTDGGYLNIDSHNSDVSVTNSTLTGTPDWTGAEIAIRVNDWTISRRPITGQSSGTITYSGGLYYSVVNGYGFFIQNDVRTLDTQNEWYYNPTTKKVSIYSTSEPSNVKVSTVENLIFSNKDNLTFENLTIEGANKTCFFTDWTITGLTVNNCTIQYSGLDGFKLADQTNLTVTNSIISDINNSGIYLFNVNHGTTITDNTISNIGTIAGMGGAVQSWSCYSAITISGDNSTIGGNTITNIGYDGINFDGNNSIVAENIIDTFCTVLQDGAGVYTHLEVATGRVIRNNIILNGVGNNNGCIYDPSAFGVYFDDNSFDVHCYGNTVAYCSNAAYFLHGASEITMNDNVSFDCGMQLLIVDESRLIPMVDMNIQNNQFIAKESDQLIARMVSYRTPIEDMGIFNNNYYARPIDDDIAFQLFPTGYYGTKYNYNLEQYQNFMSPQEANSKKSQVEISKESELKFEYNVSKTPRLISLSYPMVDVRGTKYSSEVILEPFGSIVLMKDPNPSDSKELSHSYSEYLFEEPSGRTVKDSKGPVDGTIINEELRGEGAKGAGLEFTGNGYINLGQNYGENVQTEVTLSAWIKPNANSDGWQGIIMHGGPNVDSYALYIYPITKTIGFKTSGTTSSWFSVNNVNELWDGKWHQLTVTYTGSEKIIYLDGIMVSNIDATGNIESGEGYNLLIGAGRDEEPASLLYRGLIDEVRIYNYSLTGDEIRELYNNPVEQVLQAVSTTEDITICDGSSYEGWTTAGIYERVLTASSGADSIVTTNLYVNPVLTISEDITILEGESYQGWTTSGQYERTLTATTGCDSIVTTNLTMVSNLTSQTIELKEGWNIFSSYIKPTDLSIEAVLGTLQESGQLLMVEDENGNTYDPELKSTSWTNNIGDFCETEGYKIQVSSDCSLEIKGTPIDLPLDIPLKEGWNYISFPHAGSVNAMDVIQSLIENRHLVKVQDESGNTIEPWWFRWKNNIGNFESGEGYMVQVKRGCVLQIKESYEKSGLLSTDIPQTESFNVVYYGNGSNHMNINISGLNEANFQIGDELAAFDGELCVGAVRLNEAHLTNDAISIHASVADKGKRNGFMEGHSIELKGISPNFNEVFRVQADEFIGNLIYETKSSVFILLKERITENEFNSIEMKMYPNPARERVTIQFSILPESETKIILTDIAGKLLQMHQVQSTHEVLDIQSYPTGVYLVKTILGDKYMVHKLIKR